MKIATVLGTVKAQRILPGFEDIRWVQLKTEQETFVAADPVGAKPGQLALIATGPMAHHIQMDCPTDAIVLAVLEK